jgi:Cu2+-exporting ATPase
MQPTRQAMSAPGRPGACFHCGGPVPPGGQYRAVVEGAERAMCCRECVAASELVTGSALAPSYRHRARPGGAPGSRTAALCAELAHWDHPTLQRTYAASETGSLRRATLAIEGMRCRDCACLIEQRLAAVPGVREVAVNLASARADVVWDGALTKPSELLAEIACLGYRGRPYRPDLEEHARRAEQRAALWRLAIAGLGALQVMMYAVGFYADAIQDMEERYRDVLRWVSAGVTAPVLAIAGGPFFAHAWRDLRNRRIGMDVPIVLALAFTFAAGLAAAALRTGDAHFELLCMFIFLLSLGRFVEMRTRHRAAAAVEHTLRRPPASATRLQADGEHEVVSVWQLVPGDLVLLRPGETAPADGTVIAGGGRVDESMLTGEHWPRRKQPGDEVLGGTQNGESPLTLRVERVGGDTVLAGIARQVDRAGHARPPVARVADRVAARLVPGVVGVAALSGMAWAWIDPSRAFWIVVAVLVVSCPCALSLATPAALTAAGGALVRRGLLPTRGHVLQTLARATHVLFDQTGTLTEGRLRLVRALPVGEGGVDESLAIARAMEHGSGHPIARAFDAGPIPAHAPRLRAEALTAVAGRGREAVVRGRRHRLGMPEWAAAVGDVPRTLAPPTDDGTWILLAAADGPRCWFELEEVIRRDAITAVAALRALGLDVQVVSGDSGPSVRRLARRLEVKAAVSRATPEPKPAPARRLRPAGSVIVMVNDASGPGGPDVTIAVGGGSDLARSRADAVLLQDDLDVLPDAIRLARRTRWVIGESLAWAIGYNAVAIPLAAAGLVTPWGAAIGMSVSSLLVVLNAWKVR